MASNEYNGIPKVCRLRTTETNGPIIDLLNPRAIFIQEPNGWIPKTAQLKGGGVKIESQSMDDSWLISGGYEAVEETFPVGANSEQLAMRVETLQKYLKDATDYYTSDFQRGACYLEAQLTEDAGMRYARIKTGSFQIGSFAFGERTGLSNNTLVIEREPFWHGNPPGELTGPFTNWIANPSFEFWRDEGTDHTRPSGWYELNPGNRPVGWDISREDRIIAGPSHALKLGFTSHGGGGLYWGLRAQTSWPGSVEEHTFRFWVRITGASTESRFRIEFRDSGMASQASVQFNADYTGWYYLPINVPVDATGFYTMQVCWFLANPGSAVAGEAIVDRMTLTRGTWTAATWPGDFYMGCGTVWGWEDDEGYYAPKVAAAENYHFINHLDVSGVPGDVEAVTRMTIGHLGSTYGEDKNWPMLKYWLSSKRADPVVPSMDDRHISLNVDPIGYTGNSNTVAGFDTSSESVVSAALNGTYSAPVAVAGFRADGIEVTDKYTARHRVLARLRWAPDQGYEGTDVLLTLVYWIGSQINAITLDEVALEESDYFRLVNLTPRDYMDWLPYHDRPASLGFILYAQMDTAEEETGTLWVDDFQLATYEGGMVNLEFEEDQAWWIGQALILDSNEDTPMPVSIGAPLCDDWIHEAAFFEPMQAGAGFVYDTQTMFGALYVAVEHMGGVDVYRFDYRGWVPLGLGLTDTPKILEHWDNLLYIIDAAAANNVRSYHPIYGLSAPQACGGRFKNDALGFGGWLWFAENAGSLTYINKAFTATQIATGSTDDLITLEAYKRKLYIGSDGGEVWTWDHLNGAVLLGTPAAGQVSAMKVWNDLLYIAIEGFGLWTWDGNAFTNVMAHNATWGTERVLQVYDDRLYLGTGTPGVDAYVCYTDDGVNWVGHLFPSDCVSSVLQPYQGRLFCGFGNARRLPGHGVIAVDDWMIWHQKNAAKLYTANYTGGPMRLIPKGAQRFYQRLEHLDMETGDGDAPDSYILRPTAEEDTRGPQTQFSIAFDSRWRSLRSE